MAKLSQFPTIAALIREIRAALGKGETGVEHDDIDADSDRDRRTYTLREPVEIDESMVRQSATPKRARASNRIGAKGPRVAYVLVPRRKNAKDPELFQTAEIVWMWLQKHSPATAKDVERGTKLGKKTVESCLYHLRLVGLIQSKPIQ